MKRNTGKEGWEELETIFKYLQYNRQFALLVCKQEDKNQ